MDGQPEDEKKFSAKRAQKSKRFRMGEGFHFSDSCRLCPQNRYIQPDGRPILPLYLVSFHNFMAGFFADFPYDPFSVLTSLPSRSRALGAAVMAAEAVLVLRGSCFMLPECVLLAPGSAPHLVLLK